MAVAMVAMTLLHTRRAPDGQIKLFTKGADNVIYERLRKNQQLAGITANHLQKCCIPSLLNFYERQRGVIL